MADDVVSPVLGELRALLPAGRMLSGPYSTARLAHDETEWARHNPEHTVAGSIVDTGRAVDAMAGAGLIPSALEMTLHEPMEQALDPAGSSARAR